MSQEQSDIIDITPDTGIYTTFRRLSYKPWYAIAEFVDNSTQNYYDFKGDLKKIYKKEKDPGKLRIEINYDSNVKSLTIYDNANGMNLEELTRAIVLNKPPLDCSGRCEFGMGLKTAACWFGRKFTIETSRLGSGIEYTVIVNVDDLENNKLSKIPVKRKKINPNIHYTRITLENLFKPIRGSTGPRIHEQLSSMYRQDLRTNEIEILWNGAKLTFEESPLLEETLEDGTSKVWKKEVNFEVYWETDDVSLPVSGWIGIRNPGKQSDAGFVLIRRGRVVRGGPGQGYKPNDVFGQGNTFRQQRLIGELNLDMWPVSQAKDTFDWSDGLEEYFVGNLKKVSKEYMEKAENYRPPKKPLTIKDIRQATQNTVKLVSSEIFSEAITRDLDLTKTPPTKEEEKTETKKIQEISLEPVVYELSIGLNTWIFKLFWQDQESQIHWMTVNYPEENEIDVYVNMAHPFIEPYVDKKEIIELLQQFVFSLALAEKMAWKTSDRGKVDPGDIRNNMNIVLRRIAEVRKKVEN